MYLELHLHLKTDATFGRGDGVVGLVDEEVEHDHYGLPYLPGRTLKGLLVEECSNLVFTLEQQQRLSQKVLDDFRKAAFFLFGQPGSTLTDDALMRVGDAQLPKALRAAIEADVKAERLDRMTVLESLTAIRRQTAMEPSGIPERGSLRASRVILRNTSFISELAFEQAPDPDAKALLAACALSLRRAGVGRNRGRGRLTASLHDPQQNDVDCTQALFERFKARLGERIQ
jgi:CRISPR/Cas system CSM-associated protein Csm3 (group 7 of RAMP superfamily)